MRKRGVRWGRECAKRKYSLPLINQWQANRLVNAYYYSTNCHDGQIRSETLCYLSSVHNRYPEISDAYDIVDLVSGDIPPDFAGKLLSALY